MSRTSGGQVRCACQDCGAHTVGQVGPNGIAGWCPNCGSYQVTPVQIVSRAASLPFAGTEGDLLMPAPFH